MHYSLGGIITDVYGRVTEQKTNKPIKNLYAIGEIMTGIHGKNRLVGTSILDCLVFGRRCGMNIANNI